MPRPDIFLGRAHLIADAGWIMPELPEVETVAEGLRNQPIFNSRISAVHIHWERTVLPLAPGQFKKLLLNRHIQHISRRAKYMFFALSDEGGNAGFIAAHLRMTGKFFVHDANTPAIPHERVAIEFANGYSLRFCDPRKFGRISWYSSLDSITSRLGPEPHDPNLTSDKLKTLLSRSSRSIKSVLLDQSVIGGLGNIYVDEALWLARIHPLRRANELSDREVCELRHGMSRAIQDGLAKGGTSLGVGLAYFQTVEGQSGGNQHHLNVFRRNGLPCPECREIIQKMRVAQRGTHYCPGCQVLADN